MSRQIRITPAQARRAGLIPKRNLPPATSPMLEAAARGPAVEEEESLPGCSDQTVSKPIACAGCGAMVTRVYAHMDGLKVGPWICRGCQVSRRSARASRRAAGARKAKAASSPTPPPPRG